MVSKKAILTLLEVVGAVIALTLIVAAMAGVFHAKVEPGRARAERPKASPDARTAAVRSTEEAVFEEAVGTLVAARHTAVSPRIMATIQTIDVRAGDRVEEGQAIIELDSRDLQARVRQAESQLNASEAVLTQTEAEFDRKRQLYESGTIGKSEFDRAKSDYEVAKAEVARAQRGVEEAKVALDYAEIQAPVTGRVVDRLAEPGDVASPGQPILHIYDPSRLRLEAPVRESLASVVKVGDKVNVVIDALETKREGLIEEIVPQSQAGARSFTVKVALPTSDDLFAGMFGRMRIPLGKRRQLVVAADAVETIGQLEYARVVNEAREIERRFVTTAPSSRPGERRVLSGLREGETALLP